MCWGRESIDVLFTISVGNPAVRVRESDCLGFPAVQASFNVNGSPNARRRYSGRSRCASQHQPRDTRTTDQTRSDEPASPKAVRFALPQPFYLWLTKAVRILHKLQHEENALSSPLWQLLQPIHRQHQK